MFTSIYLVYEVHVRTKCSSVRMVSEYHEKAIMAMNNYVKLEKQWREKHEDNHSNFYIEMRTLDVEYDKGEIMEKWDGE